MAHRCLVMPLSWSLRETHFSALKRKINFETVISMRSDPSFNISRNWTPTSNEIILKDALRVAGNYISLEVFRYYSRTCYISLLGGIKGQEGLHFSCFMLQVHSYFKICLGSSSFTSVYGEIIWLQKHRRFFGGAFCSQSWSHEVPWNLRP